MSYLAKKLNDEDILILIFVSFLIASGIYFRFVGIGKWCFAIDEFYTATSVSKILEYGIPQFTNGGYYVRGLLFQYFEASLSLLFGFNEATLRCGPVFFNLLTMPGLYLLGKKIGGKTLGFMAVGIFSISLFEIEMSRFIRMYTAFQCFFVWYLLILIKVIVDKDQNKIKWLYSIAIFSVFVYEGSIFIVLLLFLPLLFEFTGEKKKHILISSMILFGAYFYLTFDFRHFGTTEHLPQDYQKIAGSSKSILPNLYFLNTIIETRGWLLVYVLIAFINGYFIYRLWRDINLTDTTKTIISIVVLLSLMQMYGVCILFLLGALIIGKINIKDFTNKTIRKIIVCVGITFSFWFLYGIFTDLWMKNFDNLSRVSIKKILVVLLKYPNVFDALLFPWIRAVPIISLCLLFSFLYIIFLIITKYKKDRCTLRMITFVLIFSISILGILPTPYYTTRYSFFLYPIWIILFLYAIRYLISLFRRNKYQSLSFFFLSVYLFTNTDDFRLKHLLNISTPEINFRKNFDKYKEGHFYRRYDFKSPSEYVNNNANHNDIIVSTVEPVFHYLNKLDYVFLNYESKKFTNQSILKGTKEFWTSANLIYKYSDLQNIINNTQGTTWLIECTENIQEENNEVKKISEQFSNYKVYTSIDKTVRVLKIPSANNYDLLSQTE